MTQPSPTVRDRGVMEWALRALVPVGVLEREPDIAAILMRIDASGDARAMRPDRTP